MVDISPLSRVLQIDADAGTTLVEPNVAMERLVEATLKHGLIPPIVMEFLESPLRAALQEQEARAVLSSMGTSTKP